MDVKDAQQELFDRIESEPVAVARVNDGFVLSFTVAAIERMLEDARNSPKQKIIVFIKTKDKAVGET